MPKTDTSTESVERSAKFAENCRGGWQYGADLLRDLATERDTLAKQAEDCARTCAKQAEEIRSTLYVPGGWCCVRCGFKLIQYSLDAETGTVTARDNPGETCPNCKITLWRVSWKDQATETALRLDETWDELLALRNQLAETRGKENAFRMALRQVFAWASEARPAGYENAILKIEEISESALKSERAPRQNSDDELQRMQAAVDQGKDII